MGVLRDSGDASRTDTTCHLLVARSDRHSRAGDLASADDEPDRVAAAHRLSSVRALLDHTAAECST
jgi:hypothetical protein